MDNKNVNPHFVSIIMMLSSACWQHLGKVPNPMTGKIEKELTHAKIAIEMLVMLRDKTKGNLSPEEQKMLDNVIADLQLNYAEEVNKAGTEQPAEQKEEVKQ
jgi:hypothetical protein